MASRQFATTAQCLCVMLVKASVIVAGAVSLDSKHLKLVRAVLPTARIHIEVENDVLCVNKVKARQ